MHRVFSVLALSCVTLTGCQSLATQQPPCSCEHQHAAIQQHNVPIAAVATMQQPTGIAHVVAEASHGCSSRHCKHTNAVHAVRAQSSETPARVEPTLAASHCKHCGNNVTARVQYVQVQPIIVQARPSLATHVVRSGRPLTIPAPVPADQLQLRPVPRTTAARRHTVASNEPMVSLPGMRHDQYVQLVSHQTEVSGQSQWHSR